MKNSYPVLLTASQIERLKQIQAQEQKRSFTGHTPTIHAVARQVFELAINSFLDAAESAR
ncbi:MULTISPECIES: hypothetical protein [Klebsiella]|uniref:hypothetical protein n=1 Tax=Klebsiella TaxID=570 RepID=UPI000C2B1C5B|nr:MULTISPECIES: hypothetical protein [Klebsiella]MCB3488836.1 hypothetical protein [Klebsiella variicola]PJX44050.1 hypothetical protein CWM62_05290 [Klebsiella sp. C-Nf10]PJX52931.1 hypothetical protein CWM54_15175 [Klebsiella sp. D-Nf1]